MNTPLIIFYKLFPIEIINNVQKYISPNEIVYVSIIKYLDHINEIKNLYARFVYNNYIVDPCKRTRKYSPCIYSIVDGNSMCKNCMYMNDRWNKSYFLPKKYIELFYENSQIKKVKNYKNKKV